MGMMSLRRRVMERKGGGLPYDAEIEYLENAGPLIIDCDVNPSGASSLIFNGKAGFSQNNGRAFIVSDGNPNFSHYCEFYNNNFGAFRAYLDVTLSPNTLYDVGMNIHGNTYTDFTINVGGQLYTFNTTLYQGNISNRVCLYAINLGYVAPAGLRIGASQIIVNGTVVRDIIPVRVGQLGYMFDKISEKFLEKSGVGDFILGPDKN